MAIGKSGRVIVEINPKLKEELHAKLKANSFNMKEWLEKKVAQDYPELIQPK